MTQRLCRPGARGDLYRLLNDSTQESMVIDTGSHIQGTPIHYFLRSSIGVLTHHVASVAHIKLLI